MCVPQSSASVEFTNVGFAVQLAKNSDLVDRMPGPHSLFVPRVQRTLHCCVGHLHLRGDCAPSPVTPGLGDRAMRNTAHRFHNLLTAFLDLLAEVLETQAAPPTYRRPHWRSQPTRCAEYLGQYGPRRSRCLGASFQTGWWFFF